MAASSGSTRRANARQCTVVRRGSPGSGAALGLSAGEGLPRPPRQCRSRSLLLQRPAVPPPRFRVVADGGSGQRAGHVVAGVSVSMAMRCAWIWFIGRLAWPPDPVRTGGCSAASTRWTGVRRRSRSRAVPSPSGPDRSNTGAGWCGWRTAARPRPARPGGPPSTRSTRSAARRGCAAIPTGTTGPGPGSASPRWRR